MFSLSNLHFKNIVYDFFFKFWFLNSVISITCDKLKYWIFFLHIYRYLDRKGLQLSCSVTESNWYTTESNWYTNLCDSWSGKDDHSLITRFMIFFSTRTSFFEKNVLCIKKPFTFNFLAHKLCFDDFLTAIGFISVSAETWKITCALDIVLLYSNINRSDFFSQIIFSCVKQKIRCVDFILDFFKSSVELKAPLN